MHSHTVRRRVGASAPAVLAALAVAACGSSGIAAQPSASPSSSTMSAQATACRQLRVTLARVPATLGTLVSRPAAAQSAVTAFVAQLKQDSAQAGPPVESAVNKFGADVQKALTTVRTHASDIGPVTQQLAKAANNVAAACRLSR